MNGATNPEGLYLGAFTASVDGTDEKPLRIPKGWSGPVRPVWSPDGSKLVASLWRDPDGPGRAAILNSDGSGFHVLAPGKLDASMGCSAWSRDGLKLLCTVDSSHNALYGIYSIRTDGTDLTRLTSSPFHDTVGSTGECGGGDSKPDYSPDGTQFVFMRKRCGAGPDPSSDEAGALFVENTDGTGLRQITAYGTALSHDGGNVRWSPDGTQILFDSQDHHLYLIHPDGSASTQVNVPGSPYGPTWSPDGQWIVFSQYLPPSEAANYLSGLAGRHPSGTGIEHTQLGLPPELGHSGLKRPVDSQSSEDRGTSIPALGNTLVDSLHCTSRPRLLA
jgi:Tol biopolymer transport system component